MHALGYYSSVLARILRCAGRNPVTRGAGVGVGVGVGV